VVGLVFGLVAFNQGDTPRPTLASTATGTSQAQQVDGTSRPDEETETTVTGDHDAGLEVEVDTGHDVEEPEAPILGDDPIEDWLETPLQAFLRIGLEEAGVERYSELFGKLPSEIEGRLAPKRGKSPATDLRFWQESYSIRPGGKKRKSKHHIKLSFVRTAIGDPESRHRLVSLTLNLHVKSPELSSLLKERIAAPARMARSLEGKERSVWRHEGLVVVLEARKKRAVLTLAQAKGWERRDQLERRLSVPYLHYKQAKRALLGSSPNLAVAIAEGRAALEGFDAIHGTFHGHSAVNLCHALYRRLQLGEASAICQQVRERSAEPSAKGEAAFYLARIALRRGSLAAAEGLFVEARDLLPTRSRLRPLIDMFRGIRRDGASKYMPALIEFYACEKRKKLGVMHQQLHREFGFHTAHAPFAQAEDFRIDYGPILEEVMANKRCQPTP
jgi:hypothetical protein